MTDHVALPEPELPPHYHAIIEEVCRAGDRLIVMQPSIYNAQDVAVKTDGTIVTAADLASEEILLRAIRTYAPRPHRVVSEERAPSLVEDTVQPTWFVDPLDGTRSYASGSTDFAILVSAWAAGQPMFSVVHYPALGELAVAAGRQAAWIPPSPLAAPAANASQSGVLHACYMRSQTLRRLAMESGIAAYREDEVESTRALLDVAIGAASAAVVLLCGHKSWDLAPLLHLTRIRE
ncbi:MAG: hypothetical protein JO272_14155 [Pseudonocardiales bacterium]|nr:hypothetical protein [Pseudonocardiales bacterium]